MKLKILLLPLLCYCLIYPQQQVEILQSKLDRLLSDKFFISTQASVDIYDLTERKILYQKNNKMLLHPASNMKILTSAAGLLFLGSDYMFQTKLFYTGEIINEILYGDLYVSGGGDPDFTTSDLDSLVNVISFLGIKEISGDLFGDVSIIDSFFWGNGWMWDDDPSTDSPYLSALNINDNAITVFVQSTKPGLPANIFTEPETDYVTIFNKTLTVDTTEQSTLFVNRDWLNRNNIIIASGKVKQDFQNAATEFGRVNIYKPELYFLTLFKERLNQSGINLNGSIKLFTTPSTAIHFYTFNRSFDTVLVNLNKVSDNLSAEMTLRALAEKYFGRPATAQKGLRLVDSLISLSGLNPLEYRLVDGSGLSHYNLVTAELLLSVLKYFYYQQPELYGKLYESFPVAGADGTLQSRMKGTKAENKVHAKTGTLSGVSALSGYAVAANGNIIAFSILIQNHVRNTSTAIAFQNEICNIIANYK